MTIGKNIRKVSELKSISKSLFIDKLKQAAKIRLNYSMLTPLIRKKSICIFAAQIIQMNHSFPDNAINLPFFFIIGRPRSGTTLLRTLFDAHPNVTIPLECPLIKHLSDKYQHIRLWDAPLLNMLYQDVLKQQKFDTWFINKDDLKESLLKHAGHYSF